MGRPSVGLLERYALLGANFDSVPSQPTRQRKKGRFISDESGLFSYDWSG